jgi:hypothetical protein
MIRTIRLPRADVYEADTLLTVDDESRWPSDVKRRDPKTVIDAVALDHRAIWIDEDRKGKPAGAVIIGDFLSALADDHHDLGS